MNCFFQIFLFQYFNTAIPQFKSGTLPGRLFFEKNIRRLAEPGNADRTYKTYKSYKFGSPTSAAEHSLL